MTTQKKKPKAKSFLDIIKFPNREFNLAATSPARLHTLSAKYKMLDTVEVLRWFHKNKYYTIRNIVAGQPDTRYDAKKYANDRQYRDMIDNKRRSKEHFVRISDAENPGESQMEVLILNSHNSRSKLRLILSITSPIASKHTLFATVKVIYGYAEFKHEDIAERKLDDVLKEFWDTVRPAAYRIQKSMQAIMPHHDFVSLAQDLASIKITKNSPVLSAAELISLVEKEHKFITFEALYRSAVQYIRSKNMVRYAKAENGSIWGLQKEIKINLAVLDIFKVYFEKYGYWVYCPWDSPEGFFIKKIVISLLQYCPLQVFYYLQYTQQITLAMYFLWTFCIFDQ